MPFISRPNITFCMAVSQGSSSACWNTMPRSCPQPLTSRPSTVTRPAVAISRPMAMRNAVVLPQPDGPISETISPCCTVKLTRESACTACVSLPTRRTKRLETSMRLTSPISELSFAEERERLLPNPLIDHLFKIARSRQAARTDELFLHEFELVERYRKIRSNDFGPHRFVEHKGGPRIVGLGTDDLVGETDG